MGSVEGNSGVAARKDSVLNLKNGRKQKHGACGTMCALCGIRSDVCNGEIGHEKQVAPRENENLHVMEV